MLTEVVEKLHAVRVDLPTRTHKLLRRVAALSDVSMAAFTRDLLVSHLEEEARRLRIKL